MEKNKAKESLERNVGSLRDLLRESGSYTSSAEALMPLAVQSSLLLQKMFEVMVSDGLTIEEVTRDGGRKRRHPLLDSYCSMSKEYREILSGLGVVIEGRAPSPSDELTSLLSEVGRVERRG